jgi:hypothetical protein
MGPSSFLIVIVIARKDIDEFGAIGGVNNDTFTILEWVGMDIDGYRGNTNANWSGIIDIDASAALGTNTLVTPGTNLVNTDALIATLSANGGNGVSGIDDAAIYFIGSDSDINNYGWVTTGTGAAALVDHNTSVMHRIQDNGNNFNSGIAANFSGTDIYEYYQLAWTAYAVALEGTSLFLYYDYQPWNGEYYNEITSSKVLLMEDVDTFRFKSVGSVIKIQVCVNTDVIDNYSLCKEKTIY